jgi:hypothetical protein
MDQGGSTTMWIDQYGIVSNSDTQDPTHAARNLYAALFLALV